MPTKLKKDTSDVRSGDTVKVYQKIKEVAKKSKPSADKEIKERVQVFEGLVLARKHGKEAGATITVRKIVSGVGVEKIFPLHSPVIDKIEIVRRGKTRRAKLYYLRTAKGKKARLKQKEFVSVVSQGPKEKVPEAEPKTIVEEPKKED